MLRLIRRNFGAQLVSLSVSFGERFLTIALIIRAWGPDLYADWSIILAAAGLLSLVEAGLNIYYGNVWQKAFADGDEAGFNRMLSVALTIGLALGLLCVAIIAALVIGDSIPSALTLASIEDPQAGQVFILLALSATVSLTRGSISQIYRGRGEFARGTLVALMPVLGTSLAYIVVAISQAGPVELAALHLASQIVLGWGVALVDLRRRHPSLIFRLATPSAREIKDLRDRIGWFAVQQDAPILWLQLPILVMSTLAITGPPMVAFLLLRTVIGLFRQLGAMLSIAVGVELAGAFHAGGQSRVVSALNAVGLFLAAVSAALAGAILLFGRGVVGLWTGTPELYDPTIAGWLAAGGVLAAPATPLVQTLTFTNRPRSAALATLTQMVVGLTAAALLATPYGAAGVAAGLTIGEGIAMGVLLPLLASRAFGFPALPYIGRCILATSAALVWSLGTGGVAAALFDIGMPSGLVAGLTFWTVLGFLPVLFLALPARQRSAAREWLAGAVGRLS